MSGSLDKENKYTKMQRNFYEHEASAWNLHNLDPVVGSFMAHNNWEDYSFLFKDISGLDSKVVLDFGCGPGRNIVKYASTFKRIDGVDIADRNLKNAVIWMKHNNLNPENATLYLCNGVDLDCIGDESYDIVMSTICMQHICVYELRLNYLKEFFRVLKPGGHVTIQMGYGKYSPYKTTVDYYDNNYDALRTNGACDTNIYDPAQVENDLTKIGFKNFKYYIRPNGPGDGHCNWIFFSAQK